MSATSLLPATVPSPFTVFRDRVALHQSVAAVPVCRFTDFARVEALLNRVDILEFELDQAHGRADELAALVRELEANR